VDGAVTLACVDGATLVVAHSEAGTVRRVCAPGTAHPGGAIVRLSATRAVWEDCFRALMAVGGPAEPSVAPAAEEPSPAAVAAQAAAALRDDAAQKAAQKAARAPEILEPRLRHGMLETGLTVRVEYRALRCQNVKLRWYRRAQRDAGGDTPRVLRRHRATDDQPTPAAFIAGADSPE
jgi:pyruvate/2-oxoglutarate dehydrogenase complex dihydrolipoamide acyltransferase (E2) component